MASRSPADRSLPADAPTPTAPAGRAPADRVDPRFYALLGEAPAELFDDVFYWSVEGVEDHARQWAVEIARRIGLDNLLTGDGLAADGAGRAAAGALGVDPERAEALAWILAQLRGLGLVEVDEGGPERRLRLAAVPLPQAELERSRRETLEADPANAPFLDLLDAAGEAFPEVLAGEKTGEDALLGMGRMGLWLEYFSNDNPVYAINNRLAAAAAAHRLAGRPEARVLEVGAGAGSASLALLEELEGRDDPGSLASYRLTEPAAFLRRRARRAVTARFPEAPVSADGLDIDEPWADQGVEAGSLDLVLGVNVFHVARDLAACLAEALASLAPGGWLVAGECLRPRAGQPLPAEMAFVLMDSFNRVDLDPRRRPHPGFLTPEHWVTLLEEAGFEAVTLVPDVREIRPLYPRFTTGAVCGRRPT